MHIYLNTPPEGLKKSLIVGSMVQYWHVQVKDPETGLTYELQQKMVHGDQLDLGDLEDQLERIKARK